MRTATAILRCRLCLVTPADRSAEDCARLVADALSGGDVAALFVATTDVDPAAVHPIAEAVAPIATARAVATIVQNDMRIAGHIRADGVQIDTGLADVAAARAAGHKWMVGAGGIKSRHDAMTVAEADPDFLFFGRFDGDRAPAIFDKALDLAAWWAEVAVIPAVVMGGSGIASVGEASAAGIDFVVLGRAVWDDPRGPGAAVADANARLAAKTEVAA